MLFNHIVFDFTQRVSELGNDKELSPLISSIVSFIKNNLSMKLEGQIIADQFHISRKTLNMKFKKEMGKTLAGFVSNERLKWAEKLLLYTNATLAEISDYLGYASQSHFQTRFKATKNQTPMEFRTGKTI